MRQVKENRVVSGDLTMAEFVAKRLGELAIDFGDFFGSNRVLVPIPRSSLQRPGALWPAKEVVSALQSHGFGRVVTCLSRVLPVLKSATSAAKDRPKASDHLASLQVNGAIDLPDQVTLVDDVITRGAQIMGAAWAIWTTRPDISIRAFAVLRTVSNEADFSQILAPTTGLVTMKGSDAFRAP